MSVRTFFEEPHLPLCVFVLFSGSPPPSELTYYHKLQVPCSCHTILLWSTCISPKSSMFLIIWSTHVHSNCTTLFSKRIFCHTTHHTQKFEPCTILPKAKPLWYIYLLCLYPESQLIPVLFSLATSLASVSSTSSSGKYAYIPTFLSFH